MCLICAFNPIERRDFDGLCVSCRAAVADGLYRIYTVRDSEQFFREREDGSFTVHPPKFRRIVEMASCMEHPLGWEYPHHPDPIEYRPQDLFAMWRELDKAETVLNQLTEFG